MSSDEKKTQNETETKSEAPAAEKKSVGASTAREVPMAKRGSDYRIPSTSNWAGMWKRAGLVGAIGCVVAGAGWFTDPHRFAFAYLFAFAVVMTVTLGSIFFIIIERLTSAGWSVSTRRTAEFFASSAWILPILFIPVAANVGTLYPWWGASKQSEAAPAAKGEEHSALSLLEKDAHAQTSQEPGNEPPPPPPGHPGANGPGGPGMMATPGHVPHGVEPHPGMGGPGGPAMMGGPGGPGMGGPGMMGGPGGHRGGPGGMMPGMPGAHGGMEGMGPHAHAMSAEEEEEKIETKEREETLHKKAAFLNRTFFLIRMPIYLLLWIFLGYRFFSLSQEQDATKDPELTKKAQGFAPLATLIFGLSLTFAAFDWFMSLEPMWFSTIFGVQIFAGSVVSFFAMVILVTMSLREEGITKKAITTEHYHDMGKLLFGFLVFWAYISFSQFMLIWYAGLPEETPFYHLRWDVGPWSSMSLLIVLAHFVLPFFLLLSRNVKRRLPALRFGAAWLLIMHVVEMYWLIMPNFNGGMLPTAGLWIDAACLVGVAGIYLAVVYKRMTQFPVIAVGDPRLQRSIAFENA